MRLGMHMECSVDLKLDEETAPGIAANAETVDFHRPLGTSMWSTASGRTIRHMVYSLVGCPPVKAAIYLLVHQAADGSRKILAVRATRSRFASVNLARAHSASGHLGRRESHRAGRPASVGVWPNTIVDRRSSRRALWKQRTETSPVRNST
jgi:hypothetical protein